MDARVETVDGGPGIGRDSKGGSCGGRGLCGVTEAWDEEEVDDEDLFADGFALFLTDCFGGGFSRRSWGGDDIRGRIFDIGRGGDRGVGGGSSKASKDGMDVPGFASDGVRLAEVDEERFGAFFLEAFGSPSSSLVSDHLPTT